MVFLRICCALLVIALAWMPISICLKAIFGKDN